MKALLMHTDVFVKPEETPDLMTKMIQVTKTNQNAVCIVTNGEVYDFSPSTTIKAPEPSIDGVVVDSNSITDSSGNPVECDIEVIKQNDFACVTLTPYDIDLVEYLITATFKVSEVNIQDSNFPSEISNIEVVNAATGNVKCGKGTISTTFETQQTKMVIDVSVLSTTASVGMKELALGVSGGTAGIYGGCPGLLFNYNGKSIVPEIDIPDGLPDTDWNINLYTEGGDADIVGTYIAETIVDKNGTIYNDVPLSTLLSSGELI